MSPRGAPWLRYPIVVLVASGCTDGADLDDTSSLNLTARRAWLPGERDSLIAAVKANHEWVNPCTTNVP